MEFDDEDDATYGPQIDALKKAWWNEKHAPEILDYKTEVVSILRKEVEDQEIHTEEGRSVEYMHQYHFYRMEINRVKFLLSAYLRTRLWKIQKYCIHISKNEDLMARLSDTEKDFLKEYTQLYTGHMSESFLSELPEAFRDMTVTEPENMVQEPDLDRHVFCRFEEDLGTIQLGADTDTLETRKGDVVIMRYQPISTLLREDRVSML